MAQRILKEKLYDGKIQYRVENNRIAGIFPCKWYTDTICTINDVQCDAIFDSFDDALSFCDKPDDGVVEREEVWRNY